MIPTLRPKLAYLDESLYVHQGVELVERAALPSIGVGPLPTMVNGLLYAQFARQPDPLGRVTTVRRYLTLALILAGTAYAGFASADGRVRWRQRRSSCCRLLPG